MELSTDSGIKIVSCRVIVEFGSRPGIPAITISRRRYMESVKLLLPVTAGDRGENDVEGRERCREMNETVSIKCRARLEEYLAS